MGKTVDCGDAAAHGAAVVFLFFKVLNWSANKLFWWLLITAIIYFCFGGRVWRFRIVVDRSETPVQLTPSDVFTDPVVEDKGNPK